jgi:hypothetical protein
MWGFNHNNASVEVFGRPQDPLMKRKFEGWWFHNHLDDPPPPEESVEFPAGGTTTMQIACDRGATTYWQSPAQGGHGPKTGIGSSVCPGDPSRQWHANNIEDVNGCAIGVAYKNVVADVTPDDFTVFTVNHTCVWYLNTTFEVPKNMPPCPIRKDTGYEQCICMWGWTHKADSGAEQSWFPLSNPERDAVH